MFSKQETKVLFSRVVLELVLVLAERKIVLLSPMLLFHGGDFFGVGFCVVVIAVSVFAEESNQPTCSGFDIEISCCRDLVRVLSRSW